VPDREVLPLHEIRFNPPTWWIAEPDWSFRVSDGVALDVSLSSVKKVALFLGERQVCEEPFASFSPLACTL